MLDLTNIMQEAQCEELSSAVISVAHRNKHLKSAVFKNPHVDWLASVLNGLIGTSVTELSIVVTDSTVIATLEAVTRAVLNGFKATMLYLHFNDESSQVGFAYFDQLFQALAVHGTLKLLFIEADVSILPDSIGLLTSLTSLSVLRPAVPSALWQLRRFDCKTTSFPHCSQIDRVRSLEQPHANINHSLACTG